MGPRAPCAGTLDHMADQVTRSIVFVQRRYPCNGWVLPQCRLPLDGAGCQGSGSSPCVDELPFRPVEQGANRVSLILARHCGQTFSTNPALCSDHPRGIYLCGFSAGAHLAAMMLLANWTEHGVTPNLRGFHGDRSLAGQPSPSPAGLEDPC